MENVFSGFLFGVFDGHGGSACAQVISKRLYYYIAACLLPHDSLLEYIKSVLSQQPKDLIASYNDKVQFVDDIRQLYEKSFAKFLADLSKVSNKFIVFGFFLNVNLEIFILDFTVFGKNYLKMVS